MSVRIGGLHAASFAGLIMLVSAVAPAGAQTTYPSFQQPRVVSREFNFAVADGEGTTPVVFQWREGTAAGSQLSLDVGLADSDAQDADVFFILGGQYAQSLARSTPDMPLDVLLTAGAFTQFGNDILLLSVPVGVSVGHRFPLSGTRMAITPYVHPRLALQYVTVDTPAGNESDTELDIAFDVGGSLDLSPQLALRLSATFGGDALIGDGDYIGISLAWSPRGLRTTSPSRVSR